MVNNPSYVTPLPFVWDNGFNSRTGYHIYQSWSIYPFAVWVTISRFLADVGLKNSVNVQWEAIPQVKTTALSLLAPPFRVSL